MKTRFCGGSAALCNGGANFLAPCTLLILMVLLKSNDLTGSVYQDNCFSWSNCRSVTRSFLEWVAGVNVYSRKGTRMSSAVLDSNCNSRFATLYIPLICGDINPNPWPQWRFPSGACHKPVKSNQKGIQCDYCDGITQNAAWMILFAMPWLIAPAYRYVVIVAYRVLLPHYSTILAVWRRQIVFLHWHTCIPRHKMWMILFISNIKRTFKFNIDSQEDLKSSVCTIRPKKPSP